MKFLLSAVVGVIAALLGLEAFLRFMPVNSGVRMQETTPATPYARYLPREPYVFSYGWGLNNYREGVTNAQGFVNSRDFQPGANVLVIGDSYIESFMLDYSDTVQGRLDASLGKVYAAAASGNGLADALQLSRHFIPTLRPKMVVLFVEPSDIQFIELETTRGHSSFVVAGDQVSLKHLPYTESRWKEPILKSALLRYAYYNLKFPDWLSTQFKKEASPDSAAKAAKVQRHRQQRERALAYLMAELNKLQQQYGVRFVFLVDGDRKGIYDPRRAGIDWQADEREALLRHVRQARMNLVDMQPLLAEHWRTYRERMDFLPMDGHWNKVAHSIAAQQLRREFEAR